MNRQNRIKLITTFAAVLLAAQSTFAAGQLKIKGLEAIIRDIRENPNQALMQSQLEFKPASKYSIQIPRTGRYTDSTHETHEVGYRVQFIDPIYKVLPDKYEAGTLYVSAQAIRFEDEMTFGESEVAGFFKAGDRFKQTSLGHIAEENRDLKKILNRIQRADAAILKKYGQSSLSRPAIEIPVTLIGNIFNDVKTRYEISLDPKADPKIIRDFVSAYFTELVNEESHLSMEWNARSRDGIPPQSLCDRMLGGIKSIFVRN